MDEVLEHKVGTYCSGLIIVVAAFGTGFEDVVEHLPLPEHAEIGEKRMCRFQFVKGAAPSGMEPE